MIGTKKALPRRTFLRGLGTALALPLLDAMVPPMTALAGPEPAGAPASATDVNREAEPEPGRAVGRCDARHLADRPTSSAPAVGRRLPDSMPETTCTWPAASVDVRVDRSSDFP